MNAQRTWRECVLVSALLPVLLLTLAVATHAAESSSGGAPVVLFHASYDKSTLAEKIVDNVPSPAFSDSQQNPDQPFIEDIVFDGNRRIRKDTLQARIFSRKGDAYNEETLRRDFQALWNTQFFEDVKLEVEDGSKANGKIIRLSVPPFVEGA